MKMKQFLKKYPAINNLDGRFAMERSAVKRAKANNGVLDIDSDCMACKKEQLYKKVYELTANDATEVLLTLATDSPSKVLRAIESLETKKGNL
jgi:hypothetical protein